MNLNDLRKLRNLDSDDVLEAIGLQRRSQQDWILPTLGALSVGILVGAGLGLLFAPKPGAQLREDLGKKLQQGAEQLSNTANSTFASVNNADKPVRSV